MACFSGESHDSGRRMGLSRVVGSVGYPEENSARTESGRRIRDPGLFRTVFVGRILLFMGRLVEKREGSLESWDAPRGVEKKITEKEKKAEKR